MLKAPPLTPPGSKTKHDTLPPLAPTSTGTVVVENPYASPKRHAQKRTSPPASPTTPNSRGLPPRSSPYRTPTRGTIDTLEEAEMASTKPFLRKFMHYAFKDDPRKNDRWHTITTVPGKLEVCITELYDLLNIFFTEQKNCGNRLSERNFKNYTTDVRDLIHTSLLGQTSVYYLNTERGPLEKQKKHARHIVQIIADEEINGVAAGGKSHLKKGKDILGCLQKALNMLERCSESVQRLDPSALGLKFTIKNFKDYIELQISSVQIALNFDYSSLGPTEFKIDTTFSLTTFIKAIHAQRPKFITPTQVTPNTQVFNAEYNKNKRLRQLGGKAHIRNLTLEPLEEKNKFEKRMEMMGLEEEEIEDSKAEAKPVPMIFSRTHVPLDASTRKDLKVEDLTSRIEAKMHVGRTKVNIVDADATSDVKHKRSALKGKKPVN